ncbi:hypothetical protein GF325_02365 [Candidatus Bathyarchaeota archaeon]|nr:hypothetical protein [Candidatus Bathyarchaeota archaeon]
MILNDFNVDPAKVQPIAFLGNRARKLLRSSINQDRYRQAIDIFSTHANPRAAWNAFTVVGSSDDGIILERECILEGSVIMDEGKNAALIVLGVCTIGGEVEHEMGRVMDEGNNFLAYLIDAMASWGTTETRKQCIKKIKDDEIMSDGIAGRIFRPGQAGWDIGVQSTIFELLDADVESIGVSLDPGTMIMHPLKSASFAFFKFDR